MNREIKSIISIIMILILVFSLISCNKKEKKVNPYEAKWITEDMVSSLESIKRIDENGSFYKMDYQADYYGNEIKSVLDNAILQLSSGCSAFSTYNTDNEFLLCRNYDYRHKDLDGNYTGLNVLIYANPTGKLKSINVCDAAFLNTKAYFEGSLDDGKTDISLMMLAPYMCVDGMNEAGVTASLLLVDTKEGESIINQNTGKERIIPSVLLRYIIDNCHNVEEAIEIAKSYDIYSTSGTDLHLYVTDKNGVSAVFEWRKYNNDKEHKLYVTYTNAVTNFLVGFSDAQNAYNIDGSLKELYSGFSNTYNNYKYGYGHGYHRFNAIVSTLERFITTKDNGYGIRNSLMEESQALDILRVASQNPGTEQTSFTQYSAIYNLEKLSIDFYLQRDYEKCYSFSLNDIN